MNIQKDGKNVTSRREWIEKLVESKGKVDIEELASHFGVSSMTIRRDLMHLEEHNKLIRTHGGAVAPSSLIGETPYAQKQTEHLMEKQLIAKQASTLVPEGATILVDSGTTTLELIKLLKDRNDLTIVTNDITIAAELVNASPKCIVTGGELQSGVGALFGPQTEGMIRELHVDLFFLGAHAVDEAAGVTAPTLEKAAIKKRMMEAAQTTWLICDSSKFSKRAFANVCQLTKLEGIITDANFFTSFKHENYHDNMVIAQA
ncbi:DeoR/GlpR family DNA-binding transcription regulator [Halalkalibacterium halodurans]|uniref:Transcriptional regulator n=1 Tax=Halalkalibacterium halodurans TaxID=86665 RepID=A0A0M0KBU1_ALKHA|nr:DeoR/GlpR family DNA-binding transcription regulator [Halalkalibacterium halodurans]MDY7221302.1 DeoR/GlpR family DNA-binding transcription regulator [Halalkalibacterium halodurans]MDY7240541.1 DeoR/GlpR family DNA-binding transcription regulator [Halalkalibacterium halodurans]MED3647717.1 DeoR/GlpR family DNA-binding transcription regulator [Halalkalibacterium halodurans]MED4081426.1 DeoR/GlpR family DNA-binding transcription regulator [Halalkalibacterium halodurans]MED4083292.1 DeoR/GlpR 